MKEITYFHLQGCPYCHQADRLIEEMCKEDPRYAAIKINKVEERKERELANSYDYFYVPCLWLGKTKLHEGPVTKDNLRKAFDIVLKD